MREIEEDGGDPILREAFAAARQAFGGLLNTTTVMAHFPPIRQQPNCPIAAPSAFAAVRTSTTRSSPASGICSAKPNHRID
ncbi:MAG TPA: hypothetical protein VFQ82_06215 [Stellaceae bacterium]|nr:hypothetical protein [Stellaceae bacterium]